MSNQFLIIKGTVFNVLNHIRMVQDIQTATYKVNNRRASRPCNRRKLMVILANMNSNTIVSISYRPNNTIVDVNEYGDDISEYSGTDSDTDSGTIAEKENEPSLLCMIFRLIRESDDFSGFHMMCKQIIDKKDFSSFYNNED